MISASEATTTMTRAGCGLPSEVSPRDRLRLVSPNLRTKKERMGHLLEMV